MLEHFSIFSKGGFVLWSYTFSKLKDFPINSLISDVLLEERAGISSYGIGSYTVRWTLENSLDLIFVAIHQNILQLAYVEDLLFKVKEYFTQWLLGSPYKDALVPPVAEVDDVMSGFFIKLLARLEEEARSKKRVQRTFQQSKKGKDESNSSSSSKAPSPQIASHPNAEAIENRINMLNRPTSRSGRVMRRGAPKKKSAAASPSANSSSATKKRGPRVWNDGPLSRDQEQSLNFCADDDTPDRALQEGSGEATDVIEKYGYNNLELDQGEEESEEEEEEEETDRSQKQSQKSSGLFSFFKGLTGNRELTAADIDPVLQKLNQQLISKNVAPEITESLCDSVHSHLSGRQVSTFTGISRIVTTALEEALTRILTPRKNIDILRGVAEARKENRPYTIVFMGVNGVGKSTNLAKTCFWLIQNKLKVLIAACDTFRSGAVEQLREHSRRLNVDLFERGYGKDAAGIAQNAIAHAASHDYDVVLVDTAGRMQDNEPLMRSLVKLVNVNMPDLVLFVGEALVGNDGVDQLKKFNQCLADYSALPSPRLIDGIILTKFDTIDDKVGAALSMVYTPPGQPIVFVGVGQHYTDLKKMNVGAVVKALMK